MRGDSGTSDDISIHAPPRGATFAASESPGVGKISIHAPPRGATVIRGCVYRGIELFQFTPLREGRPTEITRRRKSTLFQFTPLREGRRALTSATVSTDRISIHAPPRGATHPSHGQKQERRLFQFTPLREGRRASRQGQPGQCTFQFTPLREGRRLNSGAATMSAFYFNSRPSARGDGQAVLHVHNQLSISIHAPPRGATRR